VAGAQRPISWKKRRKPKQGQEAVAVHVGGSAGARGRGNFGLWASEPISTRCHA
jgi:hypothetical protein